MADPKTVHTRVFGALRGIPSRLGSSISSLEMDLVRRSSPLLDALYTVVVGIHITEVITRIMAAVFPGVDVFFSGQSLLIGAWRLVALVSCAVFICIFFVHSAVVVVRLRLSGGLLVIYLKVFYVFYLTIAPWAALHLALAVGSLLIPGITDLRFDATFVGLYTAGLLFLNGLLGLIDRRLCHTEPGSDEAQSGQHPVDAPRSD
jgi:hypothetical protein